MSISRSWIRAIRPRTLPLAVSSVALGSFVAYHDQAMRWNVAILSALTTLFLQILSNLANDFGDSSHGVDNERRAGPARTVQSGLITPLQMKRGVMTVILLALAAGTWLVIVGTHGLHPFYTLMFLFLGIGAIIAAVKYTIGKNPYGYAGYGDFFVFLFFGLAGVAGTYFLHTQTWNWEVVLPASAMGLLSAGVLNINNMRDRINDRQSGKHTLVVRMGIRRAKWYHLFLIAGSVVCGLVYMILNYRSPLQMLFLITIPMLWINVNKVFLNTIPEELDPSLRKLALTSLLFTAAFGIGLLV
ncbi:MAG: 1,4-dihydroxy-2-naphthoate polyprenyltransferase [Bacteroidales bacterium]|nr:1,4-dihydroxy-2-naphthoate polyprenyltransferase [Bacteroidales bacterium]